MARFPSRMPAAPSTSEPVQTEVVQLVAASTLAQPIEHPLVLHQRPVALAARDQQDVGVGHLVDRVVGDEAERVRCRREPAPSSNT